MDAAALERVYHEEATRIRAALAARLGDVGLAEDAVQDAFIEAIEHWRDGAIPANCGGWLATTARRKAIDRLRRARAGQEKLALLAATMTDSWDGTDTEDDELLGMVFACCHPALPRESQIALTLRAVCGLTTAQIAAAFLVAEPAMTQRLLRARKTLRAAHADVRVPDPDQLAGPARRGAGRRVPGLQRGLPGQRGPPARPARPRRAGGDPDSGCCTG